MINTVLIVNTLLLVAVSIALLLLRVRKPLLDRVRALESQTREASLEAKASSGNHQRALEQALRNITDIGGQVRELGLAQSRSQQAILASLDGNQRQALDRLGQFERLLSNVGDVAFREVRERLDDVSNLLTVPQTPVQPAMARIEQTPYGVARACSDLVNELRASSDASATSLVGEVTRSIASGAASLIKATTEWSERCPDGEPELRRLDDVAFASRSDVSLFELEPEERNRVLPLAVRLEDARAAFRTWIGSNYDLTPIPVVPRITRFDNELHSDSPSTRLLAPTVEQENVVYSRAATGFERRGRVVLRAEVRRYVPAHLLQGTAPVPQETASPEEPTALELPTGTLPVAPQSEPPAHVEPQAPVEIQETEGPEQSSGTEAPEQSTDSGGCDEPDSDGGELSELERRLIDRGRPGS